MKTIRAAIFGTSLLASALAQAETAIDYEDRITRSTAASWNLIAGGAGRAGDLLQGEIGFSMVSAAYHHALSSRFTIGGMIGVDYAYWSPEEAVGAAVILGMPMRINVLQAAEGGLTMKLAPALYLGFDQEGFRDEFIPGLWLDFGLSGGFYLESNFLLGAGVDVPFILGIPTGDTGRDTFVAVPILIGPMAEWHLDEAWAFTAELKLGPHIHSDFGTELGVRFMLGVGYRL